MTSLESLKKLGKQFLIYVLQFVFENGQRSSVLSFCENHSKKYLFLLLLLFFSLSKFLN